MTTLSPSERRVLCLLSAGDVLDADVTFARGNARRVLFHLRELDLVMFVASTRPIDWRWRITGAGRRWLEGTGASL